MTDKEIVEALNNGATMEDINFWMAQDEQEIENTSSFGFDSQAEEDDYFDDFEKACRC